MSSQKRIIENIDDVDYQFHISSEKNGKNIIGNIELLNHFDKFKEIERCDLLLKRILYFNLYKKYKNYLILKIATIESENQFTAHYTETELFNFTKKETTEIQIESSILSLSFGTDFKKCDNKKSNPLNLSPSKILIDKYSEDIINLFDGFVVYAKINNINENEVNSHSTLNLINSSIDKFLKDKLGESFLFVLTENFDCSNFEVQKKYKIIPNGF